MTRRMFILGILPFLGACAFFERDGQEIAKSSSLPDDEADFRKWLRKKRRYREYDNKDDAWKAYVKDRDAAAKKKEWDAYKKKAGFGS